MNDPTPGFIGKAVERKEDYRFLTGQGQYTDDITQPSQSLRGVRAQPACAREDPQHRRQAAMESPGVLAIYTGTEFESSRRLAVRLADQQHRRQPDEGTAARGARGRQGALRRRPRRAGRRRDAGAGQGRGGAGRRRLRADAGGGRHRERREEQGRRARHRGRQRLLHVGLRRQGRDRCRLRDGGARDDARVHQQPPRAQRDRAARRQCPVQPRRRIVHAVHDEPEPARRAPADDRVRARPAGAQGARRRTGCRRRLRLEDLPVCGRDRAGVGRQARRPADQVGGRAQRGVPVGRARARPRDQGRTRDRQGRQVPRAARAHDGEPRRLPVDVLVVHSDDPVRHAARRPVRDAGDLLRGAGGVHQHRAGRRVSRRRTSRGDLRRRAHRRDRGARTQDGSGRAAPQELHPLVPVRHTGRADVRHRRLRGDAGARAGGRRRQGLRGEEEREREEWPAARHGLRLLHRGLRHRAVEHRGRARRACRPVRGRRSARASDRQGDDLHRLALARAGARDHVRAGGRGQARHRPRRCRHPARRHRQDPVRHGHLRQPLARRRRHGDHQGGRQDRRQGQEDRGAPARGLGLGHRVHERRVPRGRHRPQEDLRGGCADRVRAAQLPARQARAGPQRERVLRPDQLHLSRGQLYLRGRDRPGHRGRCASIGLPRRTTSATSSTR